MHRRWTFLIGFGAAAVVVAACTGEDPSVPTGAGVPDSGAGPSADGGPTTMPTGDAGVVCTAPPRCTDDALSLVTCDGTIGCGLGCDVPNARCKLIAPSGAVGSATTTTATAPVTLDQAETYFADTTTGVIGLRDAAGQPKGAPVRGPGNGVVSGIGWALVDQPAGAPKVAVFSFGTLTIGKVARLQVVGPDAVALVTQGNLVIDGTLSVRGDCAKHVIGPGGIADGSGGAGIPGAGGAGEAVRTGNGGFNLLCGGGGGGSNVGPGGRGGEASGTTTEGVTSYAAGGLGGIMRAKTLIDLPILVGGGSGGAGGPGLATSTGGGVGGGAIQLVASGSILVSGTIDAGGCGGKASSMKSGSFTGKNCVGAGGGGAGGTIFFEAIAVKLASGARVLANGGGGGGGQTDFDPAVHTDGAINATDATPAHGGTSAASLAACPDGQDGNPPADPSPPLRVCGPTMKPVAASGAGGGLGHIAARTKDSAVLVEDGAIMNPPAARAYVVVQ